MRSGRVSGAVTGLALLALAAAGAVPPPAIAATAWRAYQLAPNSESPKVAFDSHGTAIATWTQTFYGDFTTRSDVLAVRTKGVWKTQRLPDGFTVGNPVAFGADRSACSAHV